MTKALFLSFAGLLISSLAMGENLICASEDFNSHTFTGIELTIDFNEKGVVNEIVATPGSWSISDDGTAQDLKLVSKNSKATVYAFSFEEQGGGAKNNRLIIPKKFTGQVTYTFTMIGDEQNESFSQVLKCH